ncbi:MAG: 2-5 ligase [Mucilaginibacter sp.]|nr:2-5 ligase [Mucilaginibacter sp.]
MTIYQDYLMVLSPPESIISTVKKLKEHTFNVIGAYESHYSTAHITVQYWPRKKPVWVEPLIPKLERDLQNLSSVILDINGFRYFNTADRYTIYANINSSPLTDIWFKQLRKYFTKHDAVPHITIAKNLSGAAFEKVWPYFKNRQWNEQFEIDRLTMLQREAIGHNKSYKKVKEIPFNSRYDFYVYANSKLKAPPIVARLHNEQQFSLF